MHEALSDIAFDRAYRQADQQLRVRHAKIGCVLVLTLMPAGTVLDAMVYPEWVAPFLWVRWLTNLVVAVLFGLLFTSWGQRHVRWLGSLWVLAASIGIAWMIFASEGEASPYYAGLNLVILGACLLMPYTLMEATTVCFSVLCCYLLASFAHGGETFAWHVFGNNIYFIVLTGIIGVVACHYYHLRRVEDFRLRHALDQRNRELAELDRLKTDFMANISHELRTPLTLILAPVDRLLQDRQDLPPETQRTLERIRHNGLRLLKLINDLLDAVRLDVRQPNESDTKRKIDVACYVRGLVDSVRGLAQAKRITLHVEGDAEGLIVEGDATSLEKAFLNLLTNAIKFTPEQGQVAVLVAGTDEQVYVTIEDSGMGIPHGQLSRIFDRFRQADSGSTRCHQGMGLGLALVKEWIEQHGGQVEVESTQGVGTAFTVTLTRTQTSVAEPVLTAPEHEDDPGDWLIKQDDREEEHTGLQQVHVQNLPVQDGSMETRASVLIVDDEPDMRAFLMEILQQDYNVVGVESGERALELAQERCPDAIVLDLMLPAMDGLEVCRRVRQQSELADLGVIMLTARGDERSKIQALQAGADEFLTKPFSGIEMQTRLAHLLRARRLQAELKARNQELEGTVAVLRSTRSQLVQSEKLNALGSLTAGLLHEINNPLNYTLTALQLAQQDAGKLDQSFRETLEDMGEGMGRIRDIVSDLRAFAYPDKVNSRSVFCLHEAVESALRLTAHLRGEEVVEQQVPPELCVYGSRSHITHVLVNLTSNAIRAVQQIEDGRTPQVTIRAYRENGSIYIRVIDNGIGVAEDKRRRVFDPFYTTREVGEGMGLGLSICHTIAAEHDGSISLESSEGAGTVVTVQLPL